MPTEKERKYQREYMKKYRKANPAREKESQKKSNANRDYQKWYHNKKKNDPEFIRKRKEYYQKNKAYFQKKSRECYLRTREKVKARWQAKRAKVLRHYGGKCMCCGEKRIEFLAIDHIKNDGHIHRKQIKTNIFSWIIQHHYPKNLQILCHNCNLAKAFYGYCPHQEKK